MSGKARSLSISGVMRRSLGVGRNFVKKLAQASHLANRSKLPTTKAAPKASSSAFCRGCLPHVFAGRSRRAPTFVLDDDDDEVVVYNNLGEKELAVCLPLMVENDVVSDFALKSATKIITATEGASEERIAAFVPARFDAPAAAAVVPAVSAVEILQKEAVIQVEETTLLTPAVTLSIAFPTTTTAATEAQASHLANRGKLPTAKAAPKASSSALSCGGCLPLVLSGTSRCSGSFEKIENEVVVLDILPSTRSVLCLPNPIGLAVFFDGASHRPPSFELEGMKNPYSEEASLATTPPPVAVVVVEPDAEVEATKLNASSAALDSAPVVSVSEVEILQKEAMIEVDETTLTTPAVTLSVATAAAATEIVNEARPDTVDVLPSPVMHEIPTQVPRGVLSCFQVQAWVKDQAAKGLGRVNAPLRWDANWYGGPAMRPPPPLPCMIEVANGVFFPQNWVDPALGKAMGRNLLNLLMSGASRAPTCASAPAANARSFLRAEAPEFVPAKHNMTASFSVDVGVDTGASMGSNLLNLLKQGSGGFLANF